MIYLPHEFFIGHTVRIFPNWISNNHLLIRRSLVKNARDFQDEATASEWIIAHSEADGEFLGTVDVFATDAKVLELLAHISPQTFIITSLRIPRFTHSKRDEVVVAQPQAKRDLLQPAFFDDRYIDALGFEPGHILWKNNNISLFCNGPTIERTTISLMPVKPEKAYIEAAGRNVNFTMERL